MRIKNIRAVSYDVPTPWGRGQKEFQAKARRPSWLEYGPLSSPMTPYPRFAAERSSWMPAWPNFGCVVEAEDGTMGLCIDIFGKPVATLIDEYFGPRLHGESCMATEKIYDMMVRMCAPFGAAGLPAYAISMIDLALWDLKGKLLERPVYELLGGPSRDYLNCYATGSDTDWNIELGFKASKLSTRYGPADGPDGLKKNIEMVAEARELVGDGVELMVDCWMAYDVENAVRLIEGLKPYKLKWVEEVLRPEDLDSHAELRKRTPWQTLATGEHWYTVFPFQHAASHRLVDIFQPDTSWVGGMTALVKICAIAEAAGLSVIPHAGGTTPYGQHACYALPAIPLAEYGVGTPPGVPLEDARYAPGVPVAVNGRLVPSDAPGFGVDVDPASLKPFRY